MTVDMKPSLLGRLVTFLFQRPALQICVQTDVEKRAYRFVPGMGRVPFLLSPLLTKTDDVVDVFMERPNNQVRKIKFEKSIWSLGQVRRRFTIKLYEEPTLLHTAREKMPVRELDTLRRPAISPEPVTIESKLGVDYQDFYGEPAVLVYAPSRLVISIPERSSSFRGFLGSITGRETKTGRVTKNGLECTIDAIGANGRTRRLLNRTLNPLRGGADQGKVPFDCSVDGYGVGKLVLSTGPDQASGSPSVWAGCRFSSQMGAR
jgi:hypothetical protein